MMRLMNPLCVLLALGGLAACSLDVKNTLDQKSEIPSDRCETTADCSGGAHIECRDVDDGVSQWKSCECAFGYAADAATGECGWVGLVRDPGFEDIEAWTRSGDVFLNDQAVGGGDPGAAEFGAEGTCQYASVVQTIDLSPREATGPLVAEVHLRASAPYVPDQGIPVGVGIHGRWHSLTATSDWATQRVCLGEGVAGRQVELAVGPYIPHVDCNYPDIELQVSRVEILPAVAEDGCGAAGVIPDATFEAAELSSAWTKTVHSGTFDVGVASSLGEDATGALQLLTTSTYARGYMSAPMIWPETPGLSLKFWYKGSSGAVFEVRAGSQQLALLHGSGAAESAIICVPPWVRGTGQPLTFGARSRPYSSSWQNSGTELLIDNITVEPEPKCVDPAGGWDSSFELVNEPGFSVWPVPFENSYYHNTARAELDPLHARTGSSSYVLRSTHSCGYFCETCSDTPEIHVGSALPSEEGGAALSMWYLSEGATTFEFRTSLDGSADWLPPGDGWQRHTVCLPPGIGGRPLVYRPVFTRDPACSPSEPIDPEVMWIDDVASFVDPSCP